MITWSQASALKCSWHQLRVPNYLRRLVDDWGKQRGTREPHSRQRLPAAQWQQQDEAKLRFLWRLCCAICCLVAPAPPLSTHPTHLYAWRMPCTPATSGLCALPLSGKQWLVTLLGGSTAPKP